MNLDLHLLHLHLHHNLTLNPSAIDEDYVYDEEDDEDEDEDEDEESQNSIPPLSQPQLLLDMLNLRLHPRHGVFQIFDLLFQLLNPSGRSFYRLNH
jgi:hypothetical protein